MSDTDGFDPITLEILWSRLISIADEAAAALLRTAFSTIVREFERLRHGADGRATGNRISENTGGIASFSCILPKTTKHFLAKFPAETWRPGDCVITNDPWLATGHLPDITAVTPIFHQGPRWSASRAPSRTARMSAARCGPPIAASCSRKASASRPPASSAPASGSRRCWISSWPMSACRDQVMGDLEAQITANEVCAARVQEFLGDSGLDDLVSARPRPARPGRPRDAQRHRRPARRHLAQRDRGRWLRRGDDAHRLRRHHRRRPHDPGLRRHQPADRSRHQLRDELHPRLCRLSGEMRARPLHPAQRGQLPGDQVRAPEGSHPQPALSRAACSARQLTGHLLAGAIYKALAPVAAGEDHRRMRRRADHALPVLRPRPRMATASARSCSPRAAWARRRTATGCRPPPSPPMPAPVPSRPSRASPRCVVWKKQFRPDSGGAGRFRGGLGQEAEIEVRAPQPAAPVAAVGPPRPSGAMACSAARRARRRRS